ncbi:hypothetical protein ACQPW3_26495 [Actinosynnema sp. CA-248983]
MKYGNTLTSTADPGLRDATAGVDLDAVSGSVSLAKRAVADGLIGYTLLVAEKTCGQAGVGTVAG